MTLWHLFFVFQALIFYAGYAITGDPGMKVTGGLMVGLALFVWFFWARGFARTTPEQRRRFYCEVLGSHSGPRETYRPFTYRVCDHCGQPFGGYTMYRIATLEAPEDAE